MAAVSGSGGVMEVSTSRLEYRLEIKCNTHGWSTDFIYTSSSFGVTSISTTWGIYDEITVVNLTYVNANSFEVDGDKTAVFTPGLEICCDCGVDGLIARTVSGTGWDGVKTTVNLNAGTAITANLTKVGEIVYEYEGTGWDNDPTIIQLVGDFDAAYGQLTDSLGTSTGTYGLQDTSTQYLNLLLVLNGDKDKYEDLIERYERYAESS
jgi:hypothetical protein